MANALPASMSLSLEIAWNIFHLLGIAGIVALGFWGQQLLTVRLAAQRPGAQVLGPNPIRYEKSLLFVVMVSGFSLRLWGFDFGLPSAYHPDELLKAHFLKNMISKNTINPDFNLQPPLLLYLTWGMARVFDFLGVDFGNSITRNLAAGRFVSVLLGTATIPLLWAIGRRIISPAGGLIAASVLALSPLHVTNSRYMKEDALFLFFVLGCVLAVIKCAQEKRPFYYYLAGALAGFSVGSKYTGIVSTVIVASMPWLLSPSLSFRPDFRWLLRAPFALALIPICFMLTAPYTIGDSAQLLDIFEGFKSESRHAMRGHMKMVITPWSQLWMFHLSRSLIPGAGFLVVVLAAFGAGVALRRLETLALFVVGCVLLFYLPAEWANSKPPPQPDRYVLPCVPFVALLAAFAVLWLSEKSVVFSAENSRFSGFLSRHSVAFTLVALMLISNGLTTVRLSSEITNDTRKQMTTWMENNLPDGARVLTAGGTTYLPHIPRKFVSASLRKVLGSEDDHIVDRLRQSRYGFLIVSVPMSSQFSTESSEPTTRRKAMEEIEEGFPKLVEIRSPSGQYGFHNPTLKIFDLRSVGRAQLSSPENTSE